MKKYLICTSVPKGQNQNKERTTTDNVPEYGDTLTCGEDNFFLEFNPPF